MPPNLTTSASSRLGGRISNVAEAGAGEELGHALVAAMDAVRRKVMAGCLNAADEIGMDAVTYTVELLSVPVGDKGERSGPGEHPRMDEGVLRNSIDSVVVPDEDAAVLYLTATRPNNGTDIAPVLEFGDANGPWWPHARIGERPIFAGDTTEFLKEIISPYVARNVARMFQA